MNASNKRLTQTAPNALLMTVWLRLVPTIGLPSSELELLKRNGVRYELNLEAGIAVTVYRTRDAAMADVQELGGLLIETNADSLRRIHGGDFPAGLADLVGAGGKPLPDYEQPNEVDVGPRTAAHVHICYDPELPYHVEEIDDGESLPVQRFAVPDDEGAEWLDALWKEAGLGWEG